MANKQNNSTTHSKPLSDAELKDQELIKSAQVKGNNGAPPKQLSDAELEDQRRIKQAQESALPEWSNEDLLKAVNDLFDIQERALIHFIWLGDAAREFKEKRMPSNLHVIELALNRKNITPELKSRFKEWGFRETENGFEYDFTIPLKWHIKIPVKIYVYDTKFKLFDNPDTVWAGWDYAYIPNPFPEYWKARGFIREKLINQKPLSSQKL